MKKEPMIYVAVRLPPPLLERLLKRARRQGKNLSTVLRALIQEHA